MHVSTTLLILSQLVHFKQICNAMRKKILTFIQRLLSVYPVVLYIMLLYFALDLFLFNIYLLFRVCIISINSLHHVECFFIK